MKFYKLTIAILFSIFFAIEGHAAFLYDLGNIISKLFAPSVTQQLIDATRRGNIQLVRHLVLDEGADIRAINIDGETARNLSNRLYDNRHPIRAFFYDHENGPVVANQPVYRPAVMDPTPAAQPAQQCEVVDPLMLEVQPLQPEVAQPAKSESKGGPTEDIFNTSCCACMMATPDIIPNGCEHICLCHECYALLHGDEGVKECPICRKLIGFARTAHYPNN